MLHLIYMYNQILSFVLLSYCVFEATNMTQEARNYSPTVRPERRRQLQAEMVDTGPLALQVLASCMSQPGHFL